MGWPPGPIWAIYIIRVRTRKAYLQTNIGLFLTIPFLRETGNVREKDVCISAGQVQLDFSKYAASIFPRNTNRRR